MTVRGQVITIDGEPLDSASVALVNAKGDYLGEGVKADSTGKFAITSTSLSGNYLLVSYAGLMSMMIDPDEYTGTSYRQIVMLPKDLDEVIVTPGSNESQNWWIAAILVAGGLYLAARKKKKGNKRRKQKR